MVAHGQTRRLPQIERHLEVRKDLHIARLYQGVEWLIRRGRGDLVQRREEEIRGQCPGLLDACRGGGRTEKRLPQGVAIGRHIDKSTKEIKTDQVYRLHSGPLTR